MRPLHRRLGTATLATVDDARAGPRSLENQGSGRHPLGRYYSGIYGNSSWTDVRTKLKIKLFLIETLAAVHTPLGPGRARRGGKGGNPCFWDWAATPYPQNRPRRPIFT